MSEVATSHRGQVGHPGKADPHPKEHHPPKDHPPKDHQTKDEYGKDHHRAKDKYPPLRGGAMTNPIHTTGGVVGHRPRAGTFGRKDTIHSLVGNRDKHLRDVDRFSTTSGEQPPAMCENTFKMEPDFRYRENEVCDIIRAIIKDHIGDEKTYDCAAMKAKSLLLSNRILEQVKKLEMKRYKFVCFVMVGEKSSQSMQFSSRCLWDQRFDNYSTVHLTIGKIHATGIVFAVYAE